MFTSLLSEFVRWPKPHECSRHFGEVFIAPELHSEVHEVIKYAKQIPFADRAPRFNQGVVRLRVRGSVGQMKGKEPGI